MAMLFSPRFAGAILRRGLPTIVVLVVVAALASRFAMAEPGQNPPRYRLKLSNIEFKGRDNQLLILIEGMGFTICLDAHRHKEKSCSRPHARLACR
jgi:hypothetical protein